MLRWCACACVCQQLVGPDRRRFVKDHKIILADVAKAIATQKYGENEFADFVEKHSSVLESLGVFGHIIRTVRLLSTEEVQNLKEECANFGCAWRESYPIENSPARQVLL